MGRAGPRLRAALLYWGIEMPTPSDVETAMGKALHGINVKAGDKALARAPLKDQIELYKHLASEDMKADGKRPVVSSINLSGSF